MNINPGDFINQDQQCPARGPGLWHTRDDAARSDMKCIHCGAGPLQQVKQIPPPPPPPSERVEEILADAVELKKGRPHDPPAVPLIERVIALRNQPVSEREAGWIGREGDLWDGHRDAADAAASMIQGAINQISRLTPRSSHSSNCLDVQEILAILGRATQEGAL